MFLLVCCTYSIWEKNVLGSLQLFQIYMTHLLFTIWNSFPLHICLMWVIKLNTGFQLKATEQKTLWGTYSAHWSWPLNVNSEFPGNRNKTEHPLRCVVLSLPGCAEILTHPFNSCRQIIYFLYPFLTRKHKKR